MNISRDLIAKDQVDAVTESPIALKLTTPDDIAKTRIDVLKFGSKTDNSFFDEKVAINDSASVLIYQPDGSGMKSPLPVIYYIHGGGYVSGAAGMYDNEHHQRSLLLNCIVVAIDYRLAPENPYPAALDDCVAGIRWAHDNAEEIGIDRSRITVMGESAGGGLSAALCLYLRDNLDIRPKNQILMFPMLDYKTSEDPNSFPNKYAGEYVWTHELNNFGWRYYRGDGHLFENEIGYFSPAHASEYSSLPNTYIAVGSLDLLLEESLHYVNALATAGVSVSMEVVSGGVHGFNFLPGETARKFNERQTQYLLDVL